MESPLTPSSSRTYIIPVYKWGSNYNVLEFRKFTLPESEENTCEHATWYFYNRLDSMSAGKSAYPIEMHLDVIEI